MLTLFLFFAAIGWAFGVVLGGLYLCHLLTGGRLSFREWVHCAFEF